MTKPIGDEDGVYYRLRIEKHTQYMCLEEQAYRLLWTLNRQHANGGDYRRMTRIADKAERRWRRRQQVVRALGLDEQQVQALDIGDSVHWRGQTLTITGWNSHRDPVFGPGGRRIWAEPVLVNEQGQAITLPPIFWHEMV